MATFLQTKFNYQADRTAGILRLPIYEKYISGHIGYAPIDIHIGDARIEVSKLLKNMNPDFLILDSLHTDVFSVFYVNVLFHHASGLAYIQDIYHHEPLPEWASESYYTLNHMLSTGIDRYGTQFCQIPR